MKIQRLNSSKLFFGKWFYRIECVQAGASRIKHAGVDRVEHWCHESRARSFWEKHIDPVELYAFLTAVKPFLKIKNLQIRAEGSHFNFYCSDLELVEKIEKKLSKWIKRISGPTTTEEIEFLVNNNNKKVLCKELPKKKYRYKVFLDSSMPEDQRKNFHSWTANYGEQIQCTPATKRWLGGDQLWWSTSPYMYVESSKMLSMVGLHLGGYVRRIQEYIPRNEALSE